MAHTPTTTPDALHDPGVEWTVLADAADGRVPIDSLLDAGLTHEHFAAPHAAVTWQHVVDARLRADATTSAMSIAAALQAGDHDKAATWLRKVSTDRIDQARFDYGMGGDGELASDVQERIQWLHHWRDLREVRSIANIMLGETSSGAPGTEIAGRALEYLTEVGNRARTELVDLSAAWDEVVTEALGTPEVTSTGIADLDQLLAGGMRGGQMLTLAARPGVGKSALALGIARSVAKRGQAVLFVSLEMSRGQIVQRLIAAESRVPLEQLAAGGLSPRMQERIDAARARGTSMPLHLLDRSVTGMTAIRRTAQHLARRQELGLIVIDYLGLLLPEAATNRSRNDEVSAISRAIKLLALDLDVPVLALSQLNREVERRTGKRPTLSDLRDSGAIEQDSDVVIFLSRDDEVPTVVRLDIAKNRQGPQGRVDLAFLPDSLEFQMLAKGGF